MYKKFFENRTESMRYAKPFFDNSKRSLKYSSSFQWGAFLLTITNIITSFFVGGYPFNVAFQFLIFFFMVAYKILRYHSRTLHNKGERIRRNSFWIKFSPNDCIIEDIDIILEEKENSKRLDDYYSSNEDSQLSISFYEDFLESAFFQSELMMLNRKMLKKQFVALIITFIGSIFVLWLIFSHNLTIGVILALCSIATVSVIIDEMEKIWLTFRHTKRVREIKTKLLTLPERCNFNDDFIYECMRLQMEYSIVVNRITPIPEKIFSNNRDELNEKYNQLKKDIEPQLNNYR
ncbi:MAG: hypothetical protein GF311_18715 [Candidatus Lokiarchaeota archaeon]|nr:hypothetical protein [Candidatus Lokiarchaeota archaeon]